MKPLVRAAICLLVSSTAIAHAQATREWIDNTGQHKIEASFIGADDSHVTLRKPNGKEIRVPLARLSTVDQEYAKSLRDNPGQTDFGIADTPSSNSDLGQVQEVSYEDFKSLSRSFEKTFRSAADVMQALESFSSNGNVEASERQLAKDASDEWKGKASSGLIRHGKEWLSPAEIDSIKSEEIRFLREAHRLIDVKNDRLALERFESASRVNKEGIRSDFYLGLLNVLVAQHPLTAVKHFDEVVSRIEASPDRIVGARKANLVAALNNLAVAQVRTKKYDRAIRNWSEAIEISPQTPELVQNLGLLTRMGGTSAGKRLSNRVGDKAGDLYARATVANNSAEFDDRVGWLYMPLIDNLDGSMSDGGDGELRVVSWATGIAVTEDLLLTTTYVLGDADRFRVTGGPSGSSKVVAIDPETNLALIRVEGLNAKPIEWSYGAPAIATRLNLVGYSQPGYGSTDIRSVSTNILQVKDYEPIDLTLVFRRPQVLPTGDMVLATAVTDVTVGEYVTILKHDAVLDSGFIGGPLCDKSGKAFAVHLGARSAQASAGRNFSLAASTGSITTFLSSAIPEIEFKSSSVSEGELAGEMGDFNQDMSKTVFQIAGLKIAPRLQWSHRIANLHASGAEGGWTSYEDRSCFTCNGTGKRDCTNRSCKRGRIKQYETRQITNRDGSSATSRVPVFVQCSTCDGAGTLDCSSCSGRGTL